MDIIYFLEQRLDFIERFYVLSSAPFTVIKRKIEAAEEPFIPPHTEDTEPPFIAEYIQAEECLQVIGGACISMLSACFHLYLKSWHKSLGNPTDPTYKWTSNRGWFKGYKGYFIARCDADFEKSQCNLDLLEEITFARNRVQHQESIIFQRVHYSPADVTKLQSPFFIEESERHLLADIDERDVAWLMRPTIHIDEENLKIAIMEVSCFAKWLQIEIEKLRN